MTKINLQDTLQDVFAKLSEGNPGALRVCFEIFSGNAEIDPDCILPLTPLLHLDTWSIYGSRIWMLHKDVCNLDLVTTLGLLRAVQLGIINRRALDLAIDNRGQGLDVAAIMRKVREQLPRFGQNKIAPCQEQPALDIAPQEAAQ